MREKNGKLSGFAAPFAVASVWFGIYIGPGFAGGAQLVSFFVGKSWLGVFIGPLLTSVVAGVLCYLTLEFSRVFKVYNFRTFYDKAFGRVNIIFANIKEISAFLACITISALSFATGGRLVSDMTGLPFLVCGLITMGIIAVLVLCGQSIVLKSAAGITVALILLLAYIGIRGVGPAWDGMIEYVGNKTMNSSPFDTWIQILLYINIMAAFMDAVIPASQGQIGSKKDSLVTALIGWAMVFCSTVMMNVLFAAGMPDVTTQELPTVWVLEHLVGANMGIKILYTMIAYLAVISTGAGYLYGMVERYQEVLKKVWKNSQLPARRIAIMAILCVFGIYFGRVGIPQLVTTAYGIIGKINVPLFLIPFLVLLPLKMSWKRKKQAKPGKASAPEAVEELGL